jgi:aspartate-semialdehyde dehydrogenase
MATDRHAQKIVIAGASSLLGNELKSVLEESRFAGWDLRLVDEEVVAGTLTEAGGEPAIIQRVEEDSFRGARYAFLTGSTAFGKQCLGPAKQAGARILDFSGASLSDPDATPWFPRIESLSGRTVAKNATTFLVCSAATTAIATLALALRSAGLQRLVAVAFQPVSAAGREGIEELETQTSQLLSFQNIGTPVFGTQAAFNLLPSFGAESRHNLQQSMLQIRAEISGAVGDAAEDARIALNLVQAPVFYGMVFSVYVDLDGKVDRTALLDACRDAGFALLPETEAGPSNVSVAGETNIFLRAPAADSSYPGGWWFWGAADNLRLPAWNGCKLAEWLEE